MYNNFIFSNFSIIFSIMFVLVFGAIIFILIKGILQWNKNNNSPRISTEATIVTKREDVSHHHNNSNDHMMDSTSTTYYVTFQVPSGDRMELHVSGSEFGMLAEGDTGTLTFQGTRYISFNRF